MPASIKLQELYGDDFQMIFCHSQQASKEQWEAFAWRQKWRGNNAMWTEEPPLQVEGNSLPKCALIGVDGTILMTGNPLAFGKKLEEAVAAEIEKAKKAPEGTPKELSKAWTVFAKGDVAGAVAECDKLASDDAKKAKDEFVSRTQTKVARAKWLLENGYASDAEALIAKLQKSSKGVTEVTAKLDELSATLNSEAIKQEREASKALATLEGKICKEKPFEDGNVKKAQAIADKFKGTKAGARAAHFVELSKVKID